MKCDRCQWKFRESVSVDRASNVRSAPLPKTCDFKCYSDANICNLFASHDRITCHLSGTEVWNNKLKQIVYSWSSMGDLFFKDSDSESDMEPAKKRVKNEMDEVKEEVETCVKFEVKAEVKVEVKEEKNTCVKTEASQ
jgi:hypothetical protein